MYHVSAQGVDERMINVHYYYIASSLFKIQVSASILCQTVCISDVTNKAAKSSENVTSQLFCVLFMHC